MSSARGKRFTFTPQHGWSTSTKSPAKHNADTASSALPPLPTSACPAALLSISPTIGFESTHRTALPALISPRAHVSLTRCTSAPPATPSPRSKRKRHTADQWQRQCSDSEDDERWSYAEAVECREAVGAEVDTESVDSELFAIASRPLSILVSPLCVRERPHCPIPLSPADADAPSLSSVSSSSTAPSPRRPLFVNHIVPADKRRTSPRLNAATTRPSTAPSLSASSLCSTSMPPLTAFSLSTPSTPLSSSSAASTLITTPSSSSAASPASPSSLSLTAACRTRSQWRRFRLGANTDSNDSSEQTTDGLSTTKRAVPRRIIPTLVQDAQQVILTLPSAPLEGRTQSAGSAEQLTSPARRISIPSSPPPHASKRLKAEVTRLGSDTSRKSHALRRSWSRGEQTSMHDYLVAV